MCGIVQMRRNRTDFFLDLSAQRAAFIVDTCKSGKADRSACNRLIILKKLRSCDIY